MNEPKADGGASVPCISLLADLEKMRCKAQRLARVERKRVGKDITHFEGFCKGQWLAYDWCASRLRDIIKANKELSNK
jgi:hypothetical protein